MSGDVILVEGLGMVHATELRERYYEAIRQREQARRTAERLWIGAHRKGEYPKRILPWKPEIDPETLRLLGQHREFYGEW
jgi:hypothetical protein